MEIIVEEWKKLKWNENLRRNGKIEEEWKKTRKNGKN